MMNSPMLRRAVMQQDDDEGLIGVKIGKELKHAAGMALKVNMTRLGPIVLPLSEKIIYACNYIGRRVRACLQKQLCCASWAPDMCPPQHWLCGASKAPGRSAVTRCLPARQLLALPTVLYAQPPCRRGPALLEKTLHCLTHAPAPLACWRSQAAAFKRLMCKENEEKTGA